MEENETTTDDSPQQADERHWQEVIDDRPVDLDRIFEVLSNRRRRAVLRYLDSEAREVEIGELAELLAARECDKDRLEITAQERKRVYIGLYQNHLPKMDDANVVDYHDGRKTVRLEADAETLEPYLGPTAPDDRTRLPVALSLLFAGNVLAGGLYVWPLAAVSAAAWALVGVTALVGLVGLRALGLG